MTDPNTLLENIGDQLEAMQLEAMEEFVEEFEKLRVANERLKAERDDADRRVGVWHRRHDEDHDRVDALVTEREAEMAENHRLKAEVAETCRRHMVAVRYAETLGAPRELDLQWLANELKTQDNAATAYPLFTVQQQRTVYGIDMSWAPDHWVWMHTEESERTHSDADVRAAIVRDLEEEGESLIPDLTPINPAEHGYEKVGIYCYFEFVNAHLTRTAAQRFIDENLHNLTEPRVYVGSQHRCPEWQMVVSFLEGFDESQIPVETPEVEEAKNRRGFEGQAAGDPQAMGVDHWTGHNPPRPFIWRDGDVARLVGELEKLRVATTKDKRCQAMHPTMSYQCVRKEGHSWVRVGAGNGYKDEFILMNVRHSRRIAPNVPALLDYVDQLEDMMGMFDTITFSCPHCGALVEEQTKAGECSLTNFGSDEVPANLAGDILGNTVYCAGCKQRWIIVQLPIPHSVRVGLLKPQ